MKIVVIGGTGLIGRKLVELLRARGQEVLAASPSSGVNAVTGEGVTEALRGADVVVDVSNSPSFEDRAALEFFQNCGRNLSTAEHATGVKHHVALSVVGTPRLQSGYFRAKQAQEQLIRASGIPFTIVQATQFFEFIGAIANSGAEGQKVHASSGAMQPIAADDVAAALAGVALAAPVNGAIEIAGQERIPIADAVKRYLEAINDPREVIGDPRTPYFGLIVDDKSLVPAAGAHLGATRFDTWLARQPKVA